MVLILLLVASGHGVQDLVRKIIDKSKNFIFITDFSLSLKIEVSQPDYRLKKSFTALVVLGTIGKKINFSCLCFSLKKSCKFTSKMGLPNNYF